MFNQVRRSFLSLTFVAFLGFLLSASANQVPRQFRAWGRKAPALLGTIDPVPNAYGLASIRIPKGFKQVMPDTNLNDPETPEEFAKLGFLPFPCNPMSFVYPVTRPYPEAVNRPVRAFATPGEYVPLAFALRTLRPLHCVEVEISAYKNKNGQLVVPRSHIDLRIVKDLPVRTKEENQYIIAPKYLESFDEFDILNIPAQRTERFWLTVKIPEDAPAGFAHAQIRIRSRAGEEHVLRSTLNILPFQLETPDPEKDINFQILSNSNDPRRGNYGRDCDPGELKRIFVDMAEHGLVSNNYEHVNPHVSKADDGKLVFDFDRPGMTSVYSMNDFMHIVNSAGLTGPFCYYAGPYEWSQYLVPGLLKIEKYSPEYDSTLRQMVRAVEEQREKMGWQEFIYFIGDEPGSHAERLKLNLNCGRQIKAVNPNLRISNFFNGQWSGTKDWLLLKEVSDINCTNYITEEVIKESMEAGYQSVWGYNGVPRHSDDTRGHRVFYGFYPWKAGLKGVTQYKYRAFYADGGSSSNISGTFAYDQINTGATPYDYTYPSAEGPLPTQQWESVRQGIYDYRYLLTLRKMLEKAADKETATEAKAVMDEVLSNFSANYQSPERDNLLPGYSPEALDVWRWRIAKAILDLQK